jgi:RNA polymerase sigma-70 factor (ECF subfamily)
VSDVTATKVLLDRFHAGDGAALNELYNRYVNRVLAAVRARLGAELRQKVESWDIVQDAMLASLRNVGDFEYSSEGAFLKWLGQIVENRIRDQIDRHHAARRDHRREAALENPRSASGFTPLEAEERSGLATPSQVVMLTEDLALLERALDHLPKETRDLIVAVKLEERTYQELADETGKTPDAVRMQFNRAMEQLTKVFQGLNKGISTA